MDTGYNKDFIGNGISIPIPRLTPKIESLKTMLNSNDSVYKLDYVHYSVIMNNRTKQPLVTAFNLDQSKFLPTERRDNWKRDSRINDEDQLENHYYKHNDWDKGHMVMRNNTAWGNSQHEAQIADEESFYYTNAAFQHKNMNRDEWLSLEENIERKFTDDSNNRLCIFTGPINSDLDRYYSRTYHDTVRIPSGFFKVICYQNKSSATFNPDGLGVKAFMMFQDEEMLKDLRGRRTIQFKEYQVTIKEIEELTGLDFGVDVFNSNPLYYHDNEERRLKSKVRIFPERIPIDNIDNVVNDPEEIRISPTMYANRRVAIISALVNPKGNERVNEWVSIMNTTNKTIDVEGWLLLDNKGRHLTLKGKLSPSQTKVYKGEKLKPIRLHNENGDLRIVSTDFEIVDNVRWNKIDLRDKVEGQALIFGV